MKQFPIVSKTISYNCVTDFEVQSRGPPHHPDPALSPERWRDESASYVQMGTAQAGPRFEKLFD